MAKYKGGVTKELRRIYADARKHGIWLREFAPPADGGGWLAAAGWMSEIVRIEKKLGRKVDIEKLSMGECVSLASPGGGKTREEACCAAMAALRQAKTKS